MADPEWLANYDSAISATRRGARGAEHLVRARMPGAGGRTIAYFSAEFALHQSLPIYAGGLGVLAGDHCKEASDLGVPLVGVGFMYPQGYFHQEVSADGWQQEIYEKLNWPDARDRAGPDRRRRRRASRPCRSAAARCWWPCGASRSAACSLYLLDTDLEENAPWDRDLSARLYGGDRETRVQQEILLGIGGVRALKAIGIEPSVYHLNEGHAAFAVLQRIRDLCEKGWTFESALDEVRRTTVFTTHTPVAAGHDAFPFHMVETHLSGAWGDLGAYRERFFGLAHYDNGGGPMFNMTALAHAHGGRGQRRQPAARHVTRQMWQPIWPDTPADAAADQVGHQRRPRADLDVGGDRRAAREAPRTGLGGSSRRSGVLRSRAARFRTRSCGQARQSLRNFLFNFIRERARYRWTTRDPRRGTDRRGRHDARSQRADDRIRPALHRIQAAGADLHGRRPPRGHPQCARPAGADSVRGQGASRPTTSASIICSASTGARSIRNSAGASPSSRTTTCTSRTSWCRAATSG